ncbi:hypothetical protein MRB53_028971 [Persea americana]|uniref:Uncharacterized protein n=1 Tax=Persea americana TaxID=3435 RepID=A0ACC2KH02_PERAE|nr:hypothetical protein MRB53_028971 [Persea americana]
MSATASKATQKSSGREGNRGRGTYLRRSNVTNEEKLLRAGSSVSASSNSSRDTRTRAVRRGIPQLLLLQITHISLRSEKKMATFELYRRSTIGMCLTETLDEMVSNGTLSPELAIQVLVQFDKSMTEALESQVKSKVTIKGHLHTYRFCDNVWTFILQDALFKNEEGQENVGRAPYLPSRNWVSMNAGAEKLSDFQGFLAEISLHQTAYGKGSSQRSGMSPLLLISWKRGCTNDWVVNMDNARATICFLVRSFEKHSNSSDSPGAPLRDTVTVLSRNCTCKTREGAFQFYGQITMDLAYLRV